MARIGKVYIPKKHECFWTERGESNITRIVRLFSLKGLDFLDSLYTN